MTLWIGSLFFCHSGVLSSQWSSPRRKFSGTRSQFLGFVNQLHLVMKMHPYIYPTNTFGVELWGPILTSTTLARFAPLVEEHSPLLESFDGPHPLEFQASFKDTCTLRTTIYKIWRLRQGDHPISAYASGVFEGHLQKWKLATISKSANYNLGAYGTEW